VPGRSPAPPRLELSRASSPATGLRGSPAAVASGLASVDGPSSGSAPLSARSTPVAGVRAPPKSVSPAHSAQPTAENEEGAPKPLARAQSPTDPAKHPLASRTPSPSARTAQRPPASPSQRLRGLLSAITGRDQPAVSPEAEANTDNPMYARGATPIRLRTPSTDRGLHVYASPRSASPRLPPRPRAASGESPQQGAPAPAKQ
jgi:hypothetical protein